MLLKIYLKQIYKMAFHPSKQNFPAYEMPKPHHIVQMPSYKQLLELTSAYIGSPDEALQQYPHLLSTQLYNKIFGFRHSLYSLCEQLLLCLILLKQVLYCLVNCHQQELLRLQNPCIFHHKFV